MKITQLLCCVALVLGYLLIQVHSQSTQSTTSTFEIKAKTLSTNKFCKRKIDTVRDDSAKTITFSTSSLCVADRKNATAIGTFSSMDYTASIYHYPIIKLQAKTSVRVANRDLTVVVGSSFGIDKIIEYNEVNGVDGYQPGNDSIAKTYNLRDQTWNVVDLSKTLVDGTNDTYIYQAIVEANVTGCCVIRMSAVISSAPIQFSSPKVISRTGITQILSPSSLKVSFELMNIQYSQPSGSYLALGTVVSFRGSRRDKTKDENDPIAPTNGNSRQSTTYEKPDDASDDQAVSQFDNNVSTQLNGASASLPKPFFSFQKFISKYPTSSPTTVTRGKLISTDMKTIDVLSSDEQYIKETTDSVVARLWVSLTERVDNFVWDPSTGTPENSDYLTTSGASQQYLISLLVVLISLIVCNLL